MRTVLSIIVSVMLAFTANAEIMLEKALDDHIKQAVEAGKYQSLIIAYMQDGETLVKSYGTLTAETDDKPTADTLFELSSNSKTFAGSLLAILADRGVLSINDPVNKYLPDGVRMASLEGVEVTLKHLATHRSGVPYAPADYATDENDKTPHANYTVDDLWKSINAYKPERKAGGEYQYSAFGYGILSQALAHHMGMEYFDLLKQEILDPLGMTSTYEVVPDSERHRLAQGHLPGGEKTDLLMDQGALKAAGFMITTINDMLKYMKAHMGETKTPISEAIKLSHPAYTQSPIMGLGWENTAGSINRNHIGTGQGHRVHIGFNYNDPKRRGSLVMANTRFGTEDIGKRALNPSHKLPPIE